jgi:hypothetical protein
MGSVLGVVAAAAEDCSPPDVVGLVLGLALGALVAVALLVLAGWRPRP